ncbi:hypothetical protein STH12_04292 (plasmid) [Shewanella khirikhana]|uniref:Uncharacterized protein n=1 Tax=Shewanella khirikhana TaxID=1965282 RepID=A0ABM9SBH6_9GAMM|nr:hypothetical protein STH12_04292 [Shewanella khirikhana]
MHTAPPVIGGLVDNHIHYTPCLWGCLNSDFMNYLTLAIHKIITRKGISHADHGTPLLDLRSSITAQHLVSFSTKPAQR